MNYDLNQCTHTFLNIKRLVELTSISTLQTRTRSGPRFLSAAVNIRITWRLDMLTCMSIAQARTNCVSTFWADYGAWDFPVNFCKKKGSCEMLQCVLAFWADSAAQHFSVNIINICVEWPSRHVLVHFDCPGLHKFVPRPWARVLSAY